MVKSEGFKDLVFTNNIYYNYKALKKKNAR